MTLHYHGTPITPVSAMLEMAGRCFCVSYTKPDEVRRSHELGQSVMLDNGAFSLWISGLPTDWTRYYKFADRWLDYPTTWAVIPDEIDGPVEVQDALIAQWPFAERGAPVWHMNEPLDRLLQLTDKWPRVCIGSTSVYAEVLSWTWSRRIDRAFEALARRHKRWPWIHMLRGMNCVGRGWPFASVDSSDIARNHNRDQNTPKKMADRWDATQCSPVWNPPLEQLALFEEDQHAD